MRVVCMEVLVVPLQVQISKENGFAFSFNCMLGSFSFEVSSVLL